MAIELQPRHDEGSRVLQDSKEPLQLSGALEEYKRFNVTTNIGTEFAREVQLTDIIKSDEKIRDLAILVAQRNVVFFRNQDIEIPDQKILVEKLGRLTGKPAKSGLHVHPYTEEGSELGDQVLQVASDVIAKPIALHTNADPSKFHSTNIHSDVTYEKYGSDYAALKLVKVPEEGGDTLWFSGYEVYDRLSPSFRSYLETLTARHDAGFFHTVAEAEGFRVRSHLPRGHPENVGPELKWDHPLIRTNPVTGWKSVFISNNFTKRINDVSRDESDFILAHLFKLQAQNHDLVVRFKWETNDVAIWDNRVSYHSATFDTIGSRKGNRVLGIGERPYLDPHSQSRRESLGFKTAY